MDTARACVLHLWSCRRSFIAAPALGKRETPGTPASRRSAQAEEAQHRQNHDDETNEIDDAIHVHTPCKLLMISNA
jgi:hypothetical protein